MNKRGKYFVFVVASAAMALMGSLVVLADHELSTDEQNLYFGPGTGGTDSLTVNLINSGPDDIDVTDINFSDPNFSSPSTPPLTIPGDGTPVPVQIDWASTADSPPVTATATFVQDGHGANPVVTLAGGAAFTITTPSPLALDFGTLNATQPELGGIQAGMNSIGRVAFVHSGPEFPDVTVNTFDPNDPEFVATTTAGANPVLTAGNTVAFRVGFDPDSTGDFTDTLDFTTTAPAPLDAFSVALEGTGVTSSVVYRVNSGGFMVDVSGGSVPSFTQDRQNNTSPYFTAGNNQIATGDPANTSDGSLPASTPPTIFNTERWAPTSNLSYDFPVTSGNYVVRVYFAESSVGGPGQRLFDVQIEGSTVLSQFDIFAEAGGADIGIARAFLVPSNPNLDVNFLRGSIENPKINAIEVVSGGTASIDVSPNSVAFPTITVGDSTTRTVTVANNASAVGAAFRVTPSLSGPDANEFTISAGTTWLQPGETLDVAVTHDPTSAGSVDATLDFDVWGGGTTSVNLSATANPREGNLGSSTGSLAFGGVFVGDTETETVTLTHQGGGSADITVTDITFTGSGASSFDLASADSFSLAVGESVDVVVEFSPTAVGSVSASLRVDHTGVAESLSVSLSGSGVAPPPANDNPFIDDDDSIFEADIEWLASVGITRGCNPPVNDRFCPGDNVTRGQMAAFFGRALGLTDDGGGDLFVDDDGSTFETDIDRLATAGITRGCNPPTNDRFCPSENVTRGQMAAFFVRALGLTDDGGGDLFVDDDGSTFEADIDRLATAGITVGCNPPANDRFCPTENVTRGQMAAFFHRAADMLGLPG